jgi:hypothetical protein
MAKVEFGAPLSSFQVTVTVAPLSELVTLLMPSALPTSEIVLLEAVKVTLPAACAAAVVTLVWFPSAS